MKSCLLGCFVQRNRPVDLYRMVQGLMALPLPVPLHLYVLPYALPFLQTLRTYLLFRAEPSTQLLSS